MTTSGGSWGRAKLFPISAIVIGFAGGFAIGRAVRAELGMDEGGAVADTGAEGKTPAATGQGQPARPQPRAAGPTKPVAAAPQKSDPLKSTAAPGPAKPVEPVKPVAARPSGRKIHVE